MSCRHLTLVPHVQSSLEPVLPAVVNLGMASQVALSSNLPFQENRLKEQHYLPERKRNVSKKTQA